MTREDSGALETRPVQVGNYKFTGKILGKGTFATVEEAIHIHLKVKVIPPYRVIYIIRSFRIVLFQYNVCIYTPYLLCKKLLLCNSTCFYEVGNSLLQYLRNLQ